MSPRKVTDDLGDELASYVRSNDEPADLAALRGAGLVAVARILAQAGDPGMSLRSPCWKQAIKAAEEIEMLAIVVQRATKSGRKT